MEEEMSEEYIVDRVADFLENKVDGNWHHEKTKKAGLHQKGEDLKLIGGKKNSEYFIIECKKKSTSKSKDSANSEVWLNDLGKLITRMKTQRYYISAKGGLGINRAYKYGLGLYWKTAKVALRRIPKPIAKTLNLYIFSVNDEGVVKQFTPKQFGEEDYPDELFR